MKQSDERWSKHYQQLKGHRVVDIDMRRDISKERKLIKINKQELKK